MSEEVSKNEKFQAACSYLLGPISGLFFLYKDQKNEFVRFHAMQSLEVFGAIFLLWLVWDMVPIIGARTHFLATPPMFLSVFIPWVFLMIMAGIGKKWKVPYFGNLAERQLNQLQ